MAKQEPKDKQSFQELKKSGGILQISQNEIFNSDKELDLRHNHWLKRIKKNFGDSKVRLYEVINNGLEWKNQQIQLTKGDRVQIFLT